MKKTEVYVPARTADGTPVIVQVLFKVSDEAVRTGFHYDAAIERVANMGYEVHSHAVTFDEQDISSDKLNHWRAIADETISTQQLKSQAPIISVPSKTYPKRSLTISRWSGDEFVCHYYVRSGDEEGEFTDGFYGTLDKVMGEFSRRVELNGIEQFNMLSHMILALEVTIL